MTFGKSPKFSGAARNERHFPTRVYDDSTGSFCLLHFVAGARQSGKPTVFPFLPPRGTPVPRPPPKSRPYSRIVKKIFSCCGGGTCTRDLKVMSPNELLLLHPANKGLYA